MNPDEPWRDTMIGMDECVGSALSGRQKLEHQFANKYFSFGTKVAGICGWSKHVVKWFPFDSIFHNNQFKAEDAFRKNGMII